MASVRNKNATAELSSCLANSPGVESFQSLTFPGNFHLMQQLEILKRGEEIPQVLTGIM